jgi:hypothetical protein
MALEKIRPRVVDATGDYTFNNVTATGNLIALNANLGNAATANYVKTDNLLYANGVAWNFSAGVSSVAGSNTQVQFNDASSFGASANFTFNKTSNTLTVTNITANGAGLSSIAGANVTGTVANANYAAYAGNITIAAQSNITSVGTLSSLSVTGNISSGNANLGNLVIANYFSGSGNNLSNIQGSNVSGAVAYATTANAVAGANVSGQVTYAATANAVAGANVMGAVSLATYATTANAVAGANVSGAVAYATTANSVAGANVSGQVANANVAYFVNVTANSTDTSTFFLTYVSSTGNSALYVDGNAHDLEYQPSSGNLTAARFIGNGSGLSSLVGANVTGTVANSTYSVSAGTAGTVTTNAQPNITSVGTLTGLTVGNATANTIFGNGTITATGDISGANLTLSGNLVVSGTTTSVNSTVTRVVDPIIEYGGGANGAALASNDSKDRGTLLHYYTTVPVDAFMGWDSSNSEFAFGSNVTVSSEVTTFNSFGNVRANFFIGNGSALSGISAVTAVSLVNGNSNVVVAANSNVTISVTSVSNVATFTSTGMNLVSSGTANLGNLVKANFLQGDGYLISNIGNVNTIYLGNSNVSIPVANGNVSVYSAGNNTMTITGTGVNVAGTLTTVGNISAGSNYFLGNGFYLSGIDAAGQVANGTSNIRIPTAGANITFTVNAVTVANITSTGFALLGTGNITAGNVYANAGTIGASALTGTLSTANQYNVTNVGTLGNLAVTTNITSGNVYANSGIVKGQYIYGDGSNLTGLGGAGYIFNGTSNVFIATANGNVSFTVGGYTGIMTVTTTGANIGGYANVTGNLAVVGNITSGNANLGNAATANYFIGNLYGNANSANTVINATQSNITSVGTLTSLTVSGITNLGSAGNVYIGGGAANYYLKTDGAGNLSWAAVSGSGGGGTSLTYTSDTSPPATGNLLGDQWFNTTANVLYEYISDGTASYWVDISSPTFSATPSTSGTTSVTLSPFLLMGA